MDMVTCIDEFVFGISSPYDGIIIVKTKTKKISEKLNMPNLFKLFKSFHSSDVVIFRYCSSNQMIYYWISLANMKSLNSIFNFFVRLCDSFMLTHVFCP